MSSSHESSLPSPPSHPSGIKLYVRRRTKSLVRVLHRKMTGSPSSVRFRENICDSTGPPVLMHRSQFMPWTNSPEGSLLSPLSSKTPSPRRWKVHKSRNVGRAANGTPGLTLSTGFCAHLSLVLIISQVCHISHQGYSKRPRNPVALLSHCTFVVLVYALASAANRTTTNS